MFIKRYLFFLSPWNFQGRSRGVKDAPWNSLALTFESSLLFPKATAKRRFARGRDRERRATREASRGLTKNLRWRGNNGDVLQAADTRCALKREFDEAELVCRKCQVDDATTRATGGKKSK